MKANMNKIYFSLVLVFFLLFGITNVCLGHYAWIQVDKFEPHPQEKIETFIANGHKFPVMADFMEASRLDDIYLVNNQHKIGITSTSKYKLQSEKKLKKGTYILAAHSNYFSSETPDGYYKFKTKKDLDNVTKCEQNHKCMKSIINVGKARKKVSRTIGHSIEIIPLKNPLALDQGGIMPIRVILNGEPLQNSEVYATYMGFHSPKDGYSGFAQTVKTNKEGLAKIELTHKGIWLIKAYASTSYPNRKVCDIKEFIASLTFRFK